MGGHRGGGGLGQDGGEVQPGQPPELDGGDDRAHEAGAVGLLLLTVPDRPGPAPDRPATGVEVVGHEHVAVGLGQVGGPSLGQPGHQVGGLGHHLVVGCGRRLPPAVGLHPPKPPVAIGAHRGVGPHPAVEIEGVAQTS